jgi:hypothetical protein
VCVLCAIKDSLSLLNRDIFVFIVYLCVLCCCMGDIHTLLCSACVLLCFVIYCSSVIDEGVKSVLHIRTMPFWSPHSTSMYF